MNPENEPSQEENIEELADIRKNAYGNDLLGTQDRVVGFINDIRKDNPDIEKYRLYHLLTGSTPRESDEYLEFDLPGGEIEKFIREELGAIKPKES